jgi:hypothetical protein
MVTISSLTTVEIGFKSPGKPLEAKFPNGPTTLLYDQKELFDCLSFHFSQIANGSIGIGSTTFDTVNQPTSRVYCLEVKIKNTADFLAVFALPLDRHSFGLAKKEILNDLHGVSKPASDSNQDKRRTIDKMLEVLQNHGVGYLLCDLNDKENALNRELLLFAFRNSSTTIVFLDKGSTNQAAINYRVTRSKGLLVKDDLVNLVFVFVFCFIFAFCDYSAFCQLFSQRYLTGALSAALSVFCFLVDLNVCSGPYESTLLGQHSSKELLRIETFYASASSLGCIFGMFFGNYYASSNQIIPTTGIGVPVLFIFTGLIFSFLVLAPFISKSLFFLFKKIGKKTRY